MKIFNKESALPYVEAGQFVNLSLEHINHITKLKKGKYVDFIGFKQDTCTFCGVRRTFPLNRAEKLMAAMGDEVIDIKVPVLFNGEEGITSFNTGDRVAHLDTWERGNIFQLNGYDKQFTVTANPFTILSDEELS